MAKQKVYVSPPGWPAPPAGWTPPPEWQPDPSWGPAPDGWVFWVERRANPRGWLYAGIAALTVALLFFALGAAITRSTPSPELVGVFLGRAVVAGVVTGVISHVSTRRWPEWLYLVIALGTYVVITGLSTIGQQAGSR